MNTKFLLVLGDTNNGEGVLDRDDEIMRLRDVGLNFAQSPSVGAIYEVYSEDAKNFSESIREEGFKVGVYGSLEKATSFFWKTLGFSADGNLDLSELEVIDLPVSEEVKYD